MCKRVNHNEFEPYVLVLLHRELVEHVAKVSTATDRVCTVDHVLMQCDILWCSRSPFEDWRQSCSSEPVLCNMEIAQKQMLKSDAWKLACNVT